MQDAAERERWWAARMWRPGDAAPRKGGGGGKSKRSKKSKKHRRSKGAEASKGAAGDDPPQGLQGGDPVDGQDWSKGAAGKAAEGDVAAGAVEKVARSVTGGSGAAGKKRPRPGQGTQGIDEVGDLSHTAFVEVGSGNVHAGNMLMGATRAMEQQKPERKELSNALKNMGFMQRKLAARAAAAEEAERQRKIRDEKWVIDPSLLQSSTGALVVEPLRTAPGRPVGRRSFGAFNPNVDKFIETVEQDVAAVAQAEQADDGAIGAEEMASSLASHKRRRRG